MVTTHRVAKHGDLQFNENEIDAVMKSAFQEVAVREQLIRDQVLQALQKNSSGYPSQPPW